MKTSLDEQIARWVARYPSLRKMAVQRSIRAVNAERADLQQHLREHRSTRPCALVAEGDSHPTTVAIDALALAMAQKIRGS